MKFVVFLWIIAGFTGCGFGTKKLEKPDPDLIPQATFVTYEIHTIRRRTGPCTEDSTTNRCVDFSIDYPVINGGARKEVLDSVNAHIIAGIFHYAFVQEKPSGFQDLIDEISGAYEEIIREIEAYDTPWFLEISADIIYQDPRFISTAGTIFSFTGGAHPNAYQVYRSYDLRTGKVIGLEDILGPGYREPLHEAAEVEFRMIREIPPGKALNDHGYFFEGDRFRLNDNFAIIDQSLLFYFNPYEIAPYAMGGTELELKLTDYVKLIKEGSVLDVYKD